MPNASAIGQLEVDREIIAGRILEAAESGERDAHKLCERAIHGLTAFDYRQHGTENNHRTNWFRLEDRKCKPQFGVTRPATIQATSLPQRRTP
jgi:hypothetical protein